MNISKIVKNGFVYNKIDYGEGIKVEEYVCREYNLISIVNKEYKNGLLHLAGAIIKERYDGTPVELSNNLNLFIDEELITTLAPVDGVVEFDLTLETYKDNVLLIVKDSFDELCYGRIK